MVINTNFSLIPAMKSHPPRHSFPSKCRANGGDYVTEVMRELQQTFAGALTPVA